MLTVLSYTGASPQHGPLFQDIAQYTYSLSARTQNSVAQPVQPVEEEPAIKKRKLQSGDAVKSSAGVSDLASDAPLQFYVQDVSFSVPQRKKLALEITAAGGLLRARNQTSKEIEFGIPMGKIRKCSGRRSAMAWNPFLMICGRGQNMYFVSLYPRNLNGCSISASFPSTATGSPLFRQAKRSRSL